MSGLVESVRTVPLTWVVTVYRSYVSPRVRLEIVAISHGVSSSQRVPSVADVAYPHRPTAKSVVGEQRVASSQCAAVGVDVILARRRRQCAVFPSNTCVGFGAGDPERSST